MQFQFHATNKKELTALFALGHAKGVLGIYRHLPLHEAVDEYLSYYQYIIVEIYPERTHFGGDNVYQESAGELKTFDETCKLVLSANVREVPVEIKGVTVAVVYKNTVLIGGEQYPVDIINKLNEALHSFTKS